MEQVSSHPMSNRDTELGHSENALWSWYISNLKQGTFEQIIDNKNKFQQIRRNSSSATVKLIVSVPEGLLQHSPHIQWHQVIAEKLEQYLPEAPVQQLDEVTTTNERLFLIEDTENRFIYKFRIELIRSNLLPMLKPQVTQPLSPPTSGGEDEEGVDKDDDDEEGAFANGGHALDQFKRDLIHVVEESDDSIVTDTDMEDDDDDDDDEESGAIILNFTRKRRCNHMKQSPTRVENDLFFSPVDSEVLSINSLDNSFGLDADLSRNADDDFLSLRKIAANITNTSNTDKSAFTVSSGKELDLKLVAAVCRDEREPDSFSTAIRQEMGEDWVIYDNNFSLDNLEYCSMDEVLYGDRQVTTLLFSLVQFTS